MRKVMVLVTFAALTACAPPVYDGQGFPDPNIDLALAQPQVAGSMPYFGEIDDPVYIGAGIEKLEGELRVEIQIRNAAGDRSAWIQLAIDPGSGPLDVREIESFDGAARAGGCTGVGTTCSSWAFDEAPVLEGEATDDPERDRLIFRARPVAFAEEDTNEYSLEASILIPRVGRYPANLVTAGE